MLFLLLVYVTFFDLRSPILSTLLVSDVCGPPLNWCVPICYIITHIHAPLDGLHYESFVSFFISLAGWGDEHTILWLQHACTMACGEEIVFGGNISSEHYFRVFPHNSKDRCGSTTRLKILGGLAKSIHV